MKPNHIIYYLAYYLFYFTKFTINFDILLIPFITLPLYLYYKSSQESRKHKITFFELGFGFLGVLYVLGNYTFILLLALPSILVYLLYSKNLSKSIVAGFYLWTTFSLLVYVLSLLNLPALTIAGLLMFLIPLIILYTRRIELKETVSKIHADEVIQLLTVLFMVTLVFQGVLTDLFIPRTLGNIVYTTSFKVQEYLLEYGSVSLWHPYLAGGAPLFMADSPLLYHDMGLSHTVLSNLGLTQSFIPAFNYMIFNYILLIGVSLLYLANKLNPKENTFNTLLPMLFLTLYSFGHYFAYFGAVKALSVFPALIIVLADVLKDKKLNWMEISFLSSLALLHHFVSAIEVLIVCGIVLLMKLKTQSKTWAKTFSELKKNNFLKAMLIGLLIVAVYAIPTLQYSKYITPKHVFLSPLEFINDFTTTLPQSLDHLKIFKRLLDDVLSMDAIGNDMLHALLFYACLVYLIYRYSQTKKIPFNSITVLSGFIILLLVHGVLTQTTIGQNMEFGRGVPVIFGILLTVIVLDTYASIPVKSRKNVLILLALLILYAGYNAQLNVTEWYNEAYLVHPYYAESNKFIEKIPLDGRWMTFGIWEGVDTLMPAATGVYTSIEQFYQTQHTRTIIEDVRGGLAGDPAIYNNRTALYLTNQLVNTGTKYIWFNPCLVEGREPGIKLDPYMKVIYTLEDCNIFSLIPDSNLAVTVKVTNQQDVQKIYNTVNGHQTVWIVDPVTQETIEPPYETINEPKPLNLERPHPSEITVSGDILPGDWVLVREKYSPVWTATQDNKPLEVYKTNTGMNLMHSKTNGTIHLEAKSTTTQSILSLTTILALALIWLQLNIKSSK